MTGSRFLRLFTVPLPGLLFSLSIILLSINCSAQERGASGDAAVVDAIREASKKFETEFNATNLEGLGGLFIDNAEVVDADGTTIKGKEAILDRYKELFETHPGMKIVVQTTLVRQLSSDVVIEEGRSIAQGEGLPVEGWSPYTAIYLNRDGKWLLGCIRDFPEEPDDTPHGHLEALSWMIGKWVDESDEGKVETDCHWSRDGNYIIQDYTITGRRGVQLKGTQRIAWDSVKQTIRSWAFDNSGGFVEAVWTEADDGWIVNAGGTTPFGETGSAVRKIVPLGEELYEIQTTSQVIGGVSYPDSVVRVVRQPPEPMISSKSAK